MMITNEDQDIIDNLEEESTETKTEGQKKAKSRDDKLRENFDLFGVDRDYDYENDIEVEIKIPKDTSDNILKTSRMFKESVLSLQGYEEQPRGEKGSSVYKLVKQPLASAPIIKAYQTLLGSYCDESNLITKKKWDSYKIQAMASWDTFFKACLRDKATPEENLRTVQNNFQDILINVGEITCDNPNNMDLLFGNVNKDRDDVDRRNTFKDGAI